MSLINKEKVLNVPGRYTRYDTSASGLYSISPQTRELVGLNTSPVSLYLIAPRGKEDQKLTQLLEKYRDLNGTITVEYVDPVLTPAFVSNYTSDKVSDNSIIVVGENRSRVLRNTDLYPVNYDYDTGRTSTDFDGEGQITSAIHYVTSDVLTKVYLMNGHGENELTESFAAAMEKEGVETGRLNLTAAGQVPEDAGCLFLNVPVSDLTGREREVLTSYLEQGGRMLLITGITAAKMPNLDQVLAGYGVSAVQGMIVEGDSNYSIPSYPNFLLPEIRSSQITEPFIAEGSLLLMPNSHGIVKTEDVRSTVEVKGILTTSPNSYIKTDSSSLGYKRGDPAGPFATGVTASEQTDGGMTRIVWFSSSSMLMEEMDEMVGGNNTNLVLNAIGWMTEQAPLSNLIGLQMQIQEASISMKRLTEIMDYPSEYETAEGVEQSELDKVEGDIEFKDVTFRYGNRAPALDHISFTIPAGKKVALVGGSGSGKSTITKLLLKYYDPEDGEIDINGANLAEYTNSSVRRAIAYVPQNIELFSKTIYDNIRISRMDATLDEVKEAAKKADAHEFIRHLPLQYNTYLEEAGNGLSGGEKQRIALARAFLKDSNLYILDESTSNLDFATETLIFNMIYEQLADRSMLIVAHRLSTIRDCDLILVMDHGKIVERGTHEELLAKDGRYAELWNMQQGIFRKRKSEPAPQVPSAVVEEDDDGESITY